MANVRFVIWYNDQYTKITLKPGQCISLRNFRWHDEGSAEQIETYEYQADDGIVYSEYESYSRDCDGPHEHHSKSHFIVNQDYFNNERDEGILVRHMPEWIKGKSYQRDIYAEMAGY